MTYEKCRSRLIKLWNTDPRLTITEIAQRVRVPKGTTINWLRKLQREGEIQPRNLGPSHTEEAAERAETIRKMRQKGAIYRDIASVVGISEARVQQIYNGS